MTHHTGSDEGRGAHTHTEWGLIVVTRDGVALVPQAEICPSLESAEERARQERSFGMHVFIAAREVTEWQPVLADSAADPSEGDDRG